MPTNILCILADAGLSQALAEHLKHKGYAATFARSALEALGAVVANEPGAAICELEMPTVSGRDIVTSLTSNAPRFRFVPVIFLTEPDQPPPKFNKFLQHVCLPKPVDFQLLDAVIAQSITPAVGAAAVRRNARLSRRETETLTLSAKGMSSDEISQMLGLTRRTVLKS